MTLNAKKKIGGIMVAQLGSFSKTGCLLISLELENYEKVVDDWDKGKEDHVT